MTDKTKRTGFNAARFAADVDKAQQRAQREAWLATRPARTRQIVGAYEAIERDRARRRNWQGQ